tara:strand:+ start:364 stop:522 length:159 start_codon:yes stop_codon:yes gene_type:complete
MNIKIAEFPLSKRKNKMEKIGKMKKIQHCPTTCMANCYIYNNLKLVAFFANF